MFAQELALFSRFRHVSNMHTSFRSSTIKRDVMMKRTGSDGPGKAFIDPRRYFSR